MKKRTGIASRMMGDLLTEISRRRRVRDLLEDLAGHSHPGTVGRLVDGLEQLLAVHYSVLAGAEQTEEPVPGEPTSKPAESRLDVPAAIVPPPLSPTAGSELAPRSEPVRDRMLITEEEAVTVEAFAPVRGDPDAVPDPSGHEDQEIVQPQENDVPVSRPHQHRTTIDLGDEDAMYCHAVAPIPLEERPATRPFMLEEKGIENKEFSFALDRGGLRFFLSRLSNQAQTISKSGVLLLNKQESIRLRGVHASVLNGLRVHGMLLPFEFGTVAVGKEALFSLLDEHLYDLRDAVEDVLSTRRWTLTISILDARLAQFVGAQSPSERRERERSRPGLFSPAGGGRLDIKTLERVLGKEKKIAEGIHEEVRVLASRSGIDAVVGLDSGTSEDWKVILRAWYDVDPANIPALNRLINDIQYRHFLFELMLSLAGARDAYTLRPG